MFFGRRTGHFQVLLGLLTRLHAKGFQAYTEVCAGCHSMNYIAFRNLADLGYNEAEIKAIAAEYEVVDGPNDEGEMFTRNGIPADRIPAPYPNELAHGQRIMGPIRQICL